MYNSRRKESTDEPSSTPLRNRHRSPRSFLVLGSRRVPLSPFYNRRHYSSLELETCTTAAARNTCPVSTLCCLWEDTKTRAGWGCQKIVNEKRVWLIAQLGVEKPLHSDHAQALADTFAAATCRPGSVRQLRDKAGATQRREGPLWGDKRRSCETSFAPTRGADLQREEAPSVPTNSKTLR